MAEKEKVFKEALGILTEGGVFQETDFPLQNRSLESRVRRGELQVVAQNADGSTEPVETVLAVWVDGELERFDPKDERHDLTRQRNGSVIPEELFDDIAKGEDVDSPTEAPTREKNNAGGKAKTSKKAKKDAADDDEE